MLFWVIYILINTFPLYDLYKSFVIVKRKRKKKKKKIFFVFFLKKKLNDHTFARKHFQKRVRTYLVLFIICYLRKLIM